MGTIPRVFCEDCLWFESEGQETLHSALEEGRYIPRLCARWGDRTRDEISKVARVKKPRLCVCVCVCVVVREKGKKGGKIHRD